MAAHYLRGDTASGCPQALLLCDAEVSPDEEKLVALLDCLGIAWQSVSTDKMASLSTASQKFCVLTHAQVISNLLQSAANANQLPKWLATAESVYIYGFAEDSASQHLLRLLTGNADATVHATMAQRAFVSVCPDLPELCGPLSGLQFQARMPARQTVFDIPERGESFQTVVGTDQGQLLIACTHAGTKLFLNSCASVVDVAASCTKYIDIRETFADTVPVIMYLKFAFGTGAQADISASLIVDDPLLKPRYGFLKYSHILFLMDQYNFATTIAFIPWNWYRTDPHTVELFRDRPDRLSVCVHGCDHTGSEFAERSAALLHKRARLASQRMHQFRRRTLLHHDEVMLFPQGAFSAAALAALKLNGFVAAANTEVAPVSKEENKTTVGDLLGMAIMKYSSFPLFTRRYLAHGVENFAFDGLLGKPCLIAAHHDDFAGDARILLQVIDKLNSLHWKLRWRSLGAAFTRALNVHRNVDGTSYVQMYGTNLTYANARPFSNRTAFMKLETDFDSVQSVTVNGAPVDYVLDRGSLRFEAVVPPYESVELRITYSGAQNLPARQDNLKYRAKAVLRRYLSEFRDNYLSQNAHLQQRALRIKDALRL
jgi:hypothetical protein